MSVSQVKKRFSEFESYLGNDKEGLRRLKLLKDDVNVLRTSLAAAEQKAAQAEEIKTAARSRADDAESRSIEAESELRRLQSIVASLQAKVASFEMTRHPDHNEVDDDAMNFYTGMRSVLKHLKGSKLSKCPRTVQAVRLRNSNLYHVFRREDFSAGWSRGDLWSLGAGVAVLSALEGRIVIQSDIRLRDLSEKDHAMHNTLARLAVKWFEGNIDKSSGVDEDWKASPWAAANRDRID